MTNGTFTCARSSPTCLIPLVVIEHTALTALQPTAPEPTIEEPQPASNASDDPQSPESVISPTARPRALPFSIAHALNYVSMFVVAIVGVVYAIQSYWATRTANSLAEQQINLEQQDSCRAYPVGNIEVAIRFDRSKTTFLFLRLCQEEVTDLTPQDDKLLQSTSFCTEMREKLEDYERNIPTGRRVLRWLKRTFGQSNFKGRGRRLDGYNALV